MHGLPPGEYPTEAPNPFHKKEPMPTEAESADAILADSDPKKPMRPGGASHRVLLVFAFANGRAMTAYEASHLACNDYHGKRRSSPPVRAGLLELMSYTLPNPAAEGRPAVEAWKITQAGLDWLRANPWPA